MEDWVLWVVGAGVLAVGEMLSVTFFLGPIALAALAGAATALLGGGAVLQIVVFIVAAIASVGVLRPVARRHIRLPAPLRTGSAALVGRQAEVLERVDHRGGQVKLAGEVWTARAWDEDEVLEPGARVHVMEIDGATAVVTDA